MYRILGILNLRCLFFNLIKKDKEFRFMGNQVGNLFQCIYIIKCLNCLNWCNGIHTRTYRYIKKITLHTISFNPNFLKHSPLY